MVIIKNSKAAKGVVRQEKSLFRVVNRDIRKPSVSSDEPMGDS